MIETGSNTDATRFRASALEPADGAHPLYSRLAEEFVTLIRSGQLRGGERLPSVRQLSRQRNLSISTVLAALRLLEQQGLAEARPQSGYYVRHPGPALPEPELTRPPRAASYVGVNALFAQSVWSSAEARAGARLGAAIPSEELFPARRLQRILAAQTRRNANCLTRYICASASPSLQHQVARRYLELGCTLDEKEIVVTHGCTEALNLALRATTRPGDTVAVESPSYFGFLQILEALRLKALEIPTHPREGISLEALEVVARTRNIKACLLNANANNPLGFVMSDERKRELVRLAAANGFPLIEDDIYGDLTFSGARPKPLKSFDRDGNVILCTSFTKSLAPGLRVGAIAPGRWLDQVALLRYVSSVSTSEVVQATVAAFLESGGYDRHLRALRRAFTGQIARVSEAIAEYFPSGARVTRPAGGFVLWVELPREIDTVELQSRAMEEGINFAPGPMFSASGRFRNCLRLSCGMPWSSEVERALERLGSLIRQ